jgi:hypothetical protein
MCSHEAVEYSDPCHILRFEGRGFIRHFAPCKGIVANDDASGAKVREDGVDVVDIVGFVGIDEDGIKRDVGGQTLDRGECRPVRLRVPSCE